MVHRSMSEQQVSQEPPAEPRRAWHVRPYRPGDEQGIVALFGQTFGKPLTEARYRWKVVDTPWPVGAPTVWVADAGDRIVGHYAGTTMRFKIGYEVTRIVHACDSMTAVSIRRQGVLTAVGESAHTAWAEAGVPFVTGLHFGGWGSRRHYLGWREQFKAVWVWRLLRPEQILRRKLKVPRPLGALAATSAGLWNAGWEILLRSAGSGVEVEPVGQPGAELDALWSAVGPAHEGLVVRDRAWVTYRYTAAPELGYRLLLARRHGEPVGYLVYRTSMLDGRVIGWIADVFTAPDDAAARAALLRSALVLLLVAGADHVRALVPTGTALFSAFRRAGFLLRRGEFDISTVPLAAGLPSAMLRDPRRWFTMGGDFDVI